jgi:hypothetical protein
MHFQNLRFNLTIIKELYIFWQPGLRRKSAAARLLEFLVRIPAVICISACCGCFVLCGRGLCDGPVTRPEDSYRLWCVWLWGDLGPIMALRRSKNRLHVCTFMVLCTQQVESHYVNSLLGYVALSPWIRNDLTEGVFPSIFKAALFLRVFLSTYELTP